MKPHLTTSASPARRSAAGRLVNRDRSQSTPAGSWKAPTRFLPVARLIPVLPPTAASTMPSTVVGTVTRRTPRSQLAATNPARSVVAPPPNPTTASLRVNPAAASRSQQSASTSAVFACSASGSSIGNTSASMFSANRAACARSAGAYSTATR